MKTVVLSLLLPLTLLWSSQDYSSSYVLRGTAARIAAKQKREESQAAKGAKLPTYLVKEGHADAPKAVPKGPYFAPPVGYAIVTDPVSPEIKALEDCSL